MQKMTNINEPIGRIRLLTRKSSRSKKFVPLPSGSIKLSTLNPRAQGRESMKTAIQFTTLAFFLLQPVMSIVQARMVSNTASTVENAAKLINTKKRLPHTLPRGILLNIFGRVMKMRLGPLSGCTP